MVRRRGLPPAGARTRTRTRTRSGCAQSVSKALDIPVIPRGLALLRICMDDRYAGGGLGGGGGLRMILIPAMQVVEYRPAPQT
jgi:hypothetical protein